MITKVNTWAAVQDQRCDFQTLIAREAHESDRMDLDDTPVPPPHVRCAPRRHSLPVRLYRRLQIRFLLWRERCSREEREAYAAQGVPLGRAYLSNCLEFESEMRGRAAMLELGL